MCFNGVLGPLNSIKNCEDKNSSIIEMKSAGFWSLNTTNIHVDGNWSATASNYTWVTGTGTWADPYLIENVTIDGKSANSTIIIKNTSEYFKINNVTLHASPLTGINGGIIINNAKNGQIIDTEIYSCGFGIWINQSSNITISDCYIRINKNDSIYIGNSNNVTVTDKTDLYNNDGHGVYFENSDNNTIAYNVIHYNDLYGVYLDNKSDQNWIYENYIGYNKFDKVLEYYDDINGYVNRCYYIIDLGFNNTIFNNDLVGACTPSPIYGTLPEPEPSWDWLIYSIAGVAIIVILAFLNKKYKETKQRDQPQTAPIGTEIQK